MLKAWVKRLKSLPTLKSATNVLEGERKVVYAVLINFDVLLYFSSNNKNKKQN